MSALSAAITIDFFKLWGGRIILFLQVAVNCTSGDYKKKQNKTIYCVCVYIYIYIYDF